MLARRFSSDRVNVEQLKRQPPLLGGNQVDAIERTSADPTTHAWRRAGLAALCLSGRVIAEQIERDRAVAVELSYVAIGIRDYIEREQELLRLLETSCRRIELLSRVRYDWQEVNAEARRLE